MKQKDIISVESYDEALDRYSKTEYVVLSRNEYNIAMKQALVCKVVYSTDVKPYLIPIIISGLRRNSRVDTLNIYTIREGAVADKSITILGQVSDKEFLQIGQAYLLNYNLQI